MIDLQHVTKKYSNGIVALEDINLHIDKGEFIYLVGPSGAGKSSFIRLLNREIKASEGQIYVGDFDLIKMRKKQLLYLRRFLSIVYQDYKLLENKTVYENVAYAMEVVEKPHKEIKQRTMEVMDLVGLKNKARMYPRELSGGEKQRVAIARAVVNTPRVIIADEPTGNLDPETAWGIMEIFEEINNQGTTIIMATHNSSIVNTLKHRVVALENGRIVRDDERGEYGYEA